MPIKVNLRHLEDDNVQLEGQLPVAELDLDIHDEVVQVEAPLDYNVEVQSVEEGILVQGRLHLPLNCECVRCLKAFTYHLELPDWTLHLPLVGEEAVVVSNDCVDLTPYVREDILLEFPQHPLCDPECRGLPNPLVGKAKKTSSASSSQVAPSAWSELNRLKF
jgi:uncharacterized protein